MVNIQWKSLFGVAMMIHRTKLISFGVKVFQSSGGCCGGSRSTTAYSLPMKLDIDILPFLEEFGTSKPSFEKTGLLKIENKNFAITGVRKISQIRFVIKNKEYVEIIEKFEERLSQYIDWFNNR